MEGGGDQDSRVPVRTVAAQDEDAGVESRSQKRQKVSTSDAANSGNICIGSVKVDTSTKAEDDMAVDSSVPGVLETKMDDALRKKCKDLIKKLQEKDAEWSCIFAEDLRSNPPLSYMQRVQNPMCLTDIKRKMQSYETLEQFLRDVRRMFANCASFNIGPGFNEPEESLRLWSLGFLSIVDAKVDGSHRLMPDWEECMTVLDEVLNALYTHTAAGDQEIPVSVEFFTRPCPPLQHDIHTVDKYIRQVSTLGNTMDLSKLTHLLLEGDIKSPSEFGNKLLLISNNCKRAEAQGMFRGFRDANKYGKKITEACTLFEDAATIALKKHFPDIGLAALPAHMNMLQIHVPQIRAPVLPSVVPEINPEVFAFAMMPRTIVASDVPLSDIAKVNNEVHYFVAALSSRTKGREALTAFIKEAVDVCNGLLNNITEKVKEEYARKNARYDGFLYRPVNADIIPDWPNIIKEDSTLCLEKVEKRLTRARYANLKVLQDDVLQVLENVITYHTPSNGGKFAFSQYLDLAKSLQESFQRDLDEGVKKLQKSYNACQQILLADTGVAMGRPSGAPSASGVLPLPLNTVQPLPVAQPSILSTPADSSTVDPSPIKIKVRLPKETAARLSSA